jgi:hypothetical protein
MSFCVCVMHTAVPSDDRGSLEVAGHRRHGSEVVPTEVGHQTLAVSKVQRRQEADLGGADVRPPGLAGGREATGAGQAAVSVSVRRIRGAWIEVLTLGGNRGPSRSHVAPVHAFSVMSLFTYSCS